MKYRVSFYRKDEVIDGRAPRYMVDVEIDSPNNIKEAIEADNQDLIVVRSVYKTPDKPIRENPSHIFITSEDRETWYKNHKPAYKERLCHECHTASVKRYKRFCEECEAKRNTGLCVLCGAIIPAVSDGGHRRHCSVCSELRKNKQNKVHRERRAKQTTVERIHEQIAWAKELLKTEERLACNLASKFQGLRRPHMTGESCRACLQKFIDVQTVYLANLMAEKQEVVSFIDELFKEAQDVNSHAASA